MPLLALPARAEDPLDPYLGNPGRTLPNLVPNVEDVQVQDHRFTESGFEQGAFLWFDTRAQNLGRVPVQITIDEVETPESSTVSQCVSWRNPQAHICRETERVGGYRWHAAHDHFHYEEFAAYQLRHVAPDGRPDYSDAGLVRLSDKVSFCFLDSEQADPNARPTAFYTDVNCSAPAVMGISPGWTDIYQSDLEGQSLSLEGVPNGRYALIIDMDYANTLRETNDDDNYVEVTIEISDSDDETHPLGRKAEIVGKRWPAPSDRGTGVTTTTTTTTVPVPPTTAPTSTTTVPERVRALSRDSVPVRPVFRERPPASARAAECSGWNSTCTRSWTTTR
ncbi:MAG TPA: lysyl oxidase family protein [Acidimicrobiales bacterium]|nr:lysyl oxidase family protein [Acidimicrobiales bacterium]